MKERVLLIGIRRPRATLSEMEASLAELKHLVDTAGGEVVRIEKQELKTINAGTFIGSGKVLQIKEIVAAENIQLVIFDDELGKAQNGNLSEMIGVKVLDRTAVILDIFAKRARTREGKLQVELAQLNYRLSRLSGEGLSMSQQSGFIGNRGPGETKLELDKRRVRDRISVLRKGLQDVRKQREIHRQKRESTPIPVVSLIGYTNAGKSTLMNALTSAGVLVEDKLFATLDPTVRKMKIGSGREILVADTVGFIRNLPHQLIESFRATFEEVERSDLLIHVIDSSEPESLHQIEVVESVLSELGLSNKPCVKVYNKSDQKVLKNRRDGVYISALKRTGLDEMTKLVESALSHDLKHTHLRLPYTSGDILSELYRLGDVTSVKHEGTEIFVEANLSDKLIGRYRKYCI